MSLQMYLECEICHDVVGPICSIGDIVRILKSGWRLEEVGTTRCFECCEDEFAQMMGLQ